MKTHSKKRRPDRVGFLLRKNLRSILAFFLVMAAGFFPAGLIFAAGQDAEIFYCGGGNVLPSQGLVKVEGGGFVMPVKDRVHVKALVVPRKVQKTTVIQALDLPMGEEVFLCKEPPCDWKHVFDVRGASLPVTSCPGLLVMWEEMEDCATPEVFVEGRIVGTKDGAEVQSVRGYYSEGESLHLVARRVEDMTRARYKDKTLLYLLKRELGLTVDPAWRHEQDGSNLVLQRRVDMPLKQIGAVRIISVRGRGPEFVQFSIDSDGNGRKDSYILRAQTRQFQQQSGGYTSLIVDLRPGIRALGLDPAKARLVEPIIFIPTTYEEYRQAPSIIKIQYCTATGGEFDGAEGQNGLVQGQDLFHEKVGETRRLRAVSFDFSRLLEEEKIRGAWREISIRFKMKGPQGIVLRQARLYGVGEKAVPRYLEVPGRKLRDWFVEVPPPPFGYVQSFTPLFAGVLPGRLGENEPAKGSESPAYIPQESGSSFPKQNVGSREKGGEGLESAETAKALYKRRPASGTLCYGLKGVPKGFSVPARLILKDSCGRKSVDVRLTAPAGRLGSCLKPGQVIMGVHVKAPHRKAGGAFDTGVFIVDVNFETLHKDSDFGDVQWWEQDELLPMVLTGGDGFAVGEKGRLYLFPRQDATSCWTFRPPKGKELIPFELVLRGSLPPAVKFVLAWGKNHLKVLQGRPGTVSLNPPMGKDDSLELRLEYKGKDPVVVLERPLIRGMCKKTPLDLLKEVALVLDMKELDPDGGRLPAPEGGWVDFGIVSLEKGPHTIRVANTPYYEIKRVVLNSESKIRLGARSGGSIPQMTEPPGDAGKWMPFLVVAVALCVLLFPQWFWPWARSGLNLVRNVYFRLPGRFWALFWFVLAGCLLGVGFYRPGGSRKENLAFSLAGLFLAPALWHLGQWISDRRTSMRSEGPGSSLVKGGKSLFLWASLFLLAACIFLLLDFRYGGEQLANIAYYLLAAGAVIELGCLRKGSEDSLEE